MSAASNARSLTKKRTKPVGANRRLPYEACCCRAALIAGCLCFFYAAIMLCLWVWPLALIALFYAVRLRLGLWKGTGTAYGTARVSGLLDLYRGGLLGHHQGLILARAGHSPPPSLRQALQELFTASQADAEIVCRLFFAALTGRKRPAEDFIRLKKFCHLATFAGPGAGKSVSIIANLLSYSGACVCLDLKGELCRKTAAHRQKVFGHQIVRIDPGDIVRRHPGWHNAPPPDSLNVLDLCPRSSPDLLDWADELGNALVVRDPNEKERHWADSAELTLATLIAFVLIRAEPHERNLQLVRELQVDPLAYRGALNLMLEARDPIFGMLRRRANQMGYYGGDEFGSVMTTTGRFMSWLDSERMAAALGSTTFDPARLLAGKMTIYLCLGEDQLDTKIGFIRLLLASLLRCVTRGGIQENNQVLFMLDEAGNIGHMRCLERATTLLRGYGVRLWYFFQSIGQLRETFRDKAEVFLDAIDTQQFFGLNGMPSAELVSGRLGDATIGITTYQESWSRSRSQSQGASPGESVSWSTSGSTNHSEIGRKLLQPSEVLQLAPDQTVIFSKGVPPIVGTMVRYYNAPEFQNGCPGLPPRRTWAMTARAVAFLLVGLLAAAWATVVPREFQAPQRPGTWPVRMNPQPVPQFPNFGNNAPGPLRPRPPLFKVPPGKAPLQRQGVAPVELPVRIPQQLRLSDHLANQPLPGQPGLLQCRGG
jgi:type IV secretion system protein VirD4